MKKQLTRGILAACAASAALLASAKTDIMIFEDTEDYTNPWSDDSIIELATLFQQEGVVANFDVVGFLVQKLIENRRFDVLDSLKAHTVGSQSLYHSLHPTECEYAADEDAHAAYKHMLEYEGICVGMLRAGFGLDEIKYVTGPGDSFTYILGNVGYDLGYRVALECVKGAPYGSWYANLYNLPYNVGLERLLIPPSPEPDYKKLLDSWATRNYVGLAMHPDCIRSTEHWDIVNYHKANFCEWRKWKPAPRRAEADVQEFYRRLRKLVRALKNDPRFNVTDVNRAIASFKPRRALVPSDLKGLTESLNADFGPVKAPASYCVADVFQAAVTFLRGGVSFMPGKALGFVEKPVGIAASVTVSAADLRAAAAKLDLGWYIPGQIDVGSAKIGPADFLFAALEVLTTGAERVTLQPREQLGSFDALPGLADFKYRWTIHAKDLPAQMLADRLRWQLWTFRYE